RRSSRWSSLASIWVVGVHLHEAFRMARLTETERAIQPMRVAREQRPATKPLQLGMRHDRGHQPLADAPAAMRRQDEHVRDVPERRVVADDAREADLTAGLERAETQRPLDGAGHCLARNAVRPIRVREEPVDHVQVEPRSIRRDDDLVELGRHHALTSWAVRPSPCASRRASARAARSLAAAMNTVSSPAMVPATPARAASSSARATGCAPAAGVFTTTTDPAAWIETAKLCSARWSFVARVAVGANCAAADSGTTYPRGVLMTPSSRRSRDRVGCATAKPRWRSN